MWLIENIYCLNAPLVQEWTLACGVVLRATTLSHRRTERPAVHGAGNCGTATMTNRFLVISSLALGAVIVQSACAQAMQNPVEPADKASAVSAQPPRKTDEQRRAEEAALREARRREAVEAARNPDPTGGVYDPVKMPPAKP